ARGRRQAIRAPRPDARGSGDGDRGVDDAQHVALDACAASGPTEPLRATPAGPATAALGLDELARPTGTAEGNPAGLVGPGRPPMTARDDILGRIRTALADRPVPAPIARDYRTAGSTTADIEQFVDRLVDYRATVHRCDPEVVAARLTEILGERARARVVVPDGFPPGWRPSVEIVDEPVTTAELDDISAVLTTCAIAIAETGTIVLDAGPGQG